MDSTTILVLLILVVALLAVTFGIRIVPQSKVYIVERFGKFEKVLHPGLNLLAPGLLDVGLAQALPLRQVDEYRRHSALGRLATAAEVARTAVFLVSDRNRFMSGAKVVLDGGL